MATRVNVTEVNFLNNPSKLTDGFKLEITFEVSEDLPGDLEWELVYVGSPETEAEDQILDTAVIESIRAGRHKFVFEADGPDVTKLPKEFIVGVTVLLLHCKYNNKNFMKIGYFVANEYTDEELINEPPVEPIIEKVVRSVKTDDLRVHFNMINWDDETTTPDVEMEDKEEQKNIGLAHGGVDDGSSCIADRVASLVVSPISEM
uniref:Anti-silencing function protein 1 n=1 Tax=Steinernema glaseri TaxID=37863 RepID=A0A1I8AF51_9BILA